MTRESSHMARFSVGGGDDNGTSSSRRPKRIRKQGGPSLTLRAPPSIFNSAMRRRPIFFSEDEESDHKSPSESHNTADSGPGSEERGESPRYSPSYGESPRYSPSLFSGEEEHDNGNSTQSGTWVRLSDPDVLDCPICLNPLSPPVYQCENGHLACGPCSRKTRNRCPSCSMPIGYNRCRGIENVPESAKASCQNKKYGCKEIVTYSKKVLHEKECDYAACSCPYPGCNYVNCDKRLYTHFAAQHPNSSREFSFNDPIWIQLRKNDKQVFLQERRESTVFVLNHFIEPLGSLVNVIYIAPPTAAYVCVEFTYEVTAKQREKSICLNGYVEAKPKLNAQPPKTNCLLITSDFTCLEVLNLRLVIRRS